MGAAELDSEAATAGALEEADEVENWALAETAEKITAAEMGRTYLNSDIELGDDMSVPRGSDFPYLRNPYAASIMHT